MRCQNLSNVTLKHVLSCENTIIHLSLSSFSILPPFLFSLSRLLFLRVPLSSVNCLSLAPLEGDVYYLVLRPLLDFYFSLCGVCSMPLRWKNALLIMIIIIVLALWLQKNAKKKRNVLLNVVQIALEMLCFFKESTNPSDGPFLSSHRQMGIKMGCQSS